MLPGSDSLGQLVDRLRLDFQPGRLRWAEFSDNEQPEMIQINCNNIVPSLPATEPMLISVRLDWKYEIQVEPIRKTRIIT
ncbi:hypothetical protein ACEPAF_2163 [Sanghuangporus sanghuang]